MAAAASVTTTAPSPPTLLKASPSSLISFRPVSRRCKHLCVKTKATENDQSAKKPQKVNSILCQDCEGNGIQHVAPRGHLAPCLNNYM